jgi:hypothetical protein
VSYVDYLRWEGWCSIVLGLALAVLAFPGLLVSYTAWWRGLLFVPGVLLVLGVVARVRRGTSLARPGAWLTARPLAGAAPGRRALPGGPLRRRLLVETTVWIVAVGLWVVLGRSSGLLIFGTGLASAAFGAVQAFAGTRHVAAAQAARGERYAVARRPGLGTPELTVT